MNDFKKICFYLIILWGLNNSVNGMNPPPEQSEGGPEQVHENPTTSSLDSTQNRKRPRYPSSLSPKAHDISHPVFELLLHNLNEIDQIIQEKTTRIPSSIPHNTEDLLQLGQQLDELFTRTTSSISLTEQEYKQFIGFYLGAIETILSNIIKNILSLSPLDPHLFEASVGLEEFITYFSLLNILFPKVQMFFFTINRVISIFHSRLCTQYIRLCEECEKIKLILNTAHTRLADQEEERDHLEDAAMANDPEFVEALTEFMSDLFQ